MGGVEFAGEASILPQGGGGHPFAPADSACFTNENQRNPPMPLLRPVVLACLLTLLSACASVPPAPQGPPRVPEQVSNADWEQDMQRFAALDAASPPPRHGVLFIGSSSIRLWETLAADFPGVPVINRGFGGSELRDSTFYAGRIVIPYAPRQIVMYAGENDLQSGRTPRQVASDFRAFVQRVRRDLPKVRISYISNKPSPSRVALLQEQRQANALIREEAARLHVDFIDVFTPMLDADGQPRGELFVEDRLHMNRTGYELWRRIVAPYLTGPGPGR
jgi:lysophospholipase L1-like esterase